MGDMDFDCNDVEDVSFDPVPAGEYLFTVSEAKVTESKSGFPMLNLELSIVDGSMEGRSVFANWLMDHSNEKARNIGRARVKGLGVALGYPEDHKFTDSAEFLNDKVFGAKIKVRPAKGDYDASNEIVKTWPVGSDASNTKSVSQSSSVTSGATNGADKDGQEPDRPNWMNK